MDRLKSTFQGITAFWNRLNLNQKILFGSLFIALVVAIVVLVTMTHTEKYGLLYGGLSRENASLVVDELKKQGIKYKIGDEGSAIYVPEDQVYEARLILAKKKLPKEPVVGYEIFEKPKLGATEFVQRINYHRALEGELTRSILALEPVQSARVHIVMPEEKLFEEEEEEPKASVIVTLKPDKKLSREQILSIAYLVASAVEGLDPENVSIIDSRGNVLRRGKVEGEIVEASNRLELKQSIESYLQKKAETMLAKILGPENAIVRVDVELDFSKVMQTLEQFDPEGQVIRSEERFEEIIYPQPADDRRERVITNYEISRMLQEISRDAAGAIKHLSCAAVINGTYRVVEEEGKKVIKYFPRTEDEMQKFTDIIKAAVGFNEARGDQISVRNLPFGEPQIEIPEEKSMFEIFLSYLPKILLIIAILTMFVLLLRFVRKYIPQEPEIILPSPPPEPIPEKIIVKEEKEKEEKEPTEEKPPEPPSPETIRDRLVNVIQKNPDEVAETLEAWIDMEEKKD